MVTMKGGANKYKEEKRDLLRLSLASLGLRRASYCLSWEQGQAMVEGNIKYTEIERDMMELSLASL